MHACVHPAKVIVARTNAGATRASCSRPLVLASRNSPVSLICAYRSLPLQVTSGLNFIDGFSNPIVVLFRESLMEGTGSLRTVRKNKTEYQESIIKKLIILDTYVCPVFSDPENSLSSSRTTYNRV